MADSSPVSIVVAARQLRLPDRSVYRAVEKGRIPSTKSAEGLTLVQIEDVAAWAAGRTRRGSQGPSPGATPAVADPAQPQPPAADVAVAAAASSAGRQTAGSGAGAPGVDGELAAAAVEAFDSGLSVVEFCKRRKLSPGVALAAWEAYQQLRNASPAGDRLDTRIAELEEALAEIRQHLACVATANDDLAVSVAAVASRLSAIPAALSVVSTCESCGARWLHGQPAPCPECGEHAVTGTFSPAPRR